MKNFGMDEPEQYMASKSRPRHADSGERTRPRVPFAAARREFSTNLSNHMAIGGAPIAAREARALPRLSAFHRVHLGLNRGAHE